MAFNEESGRNIAEILLLISEINQKLGMVQSEQTTTNTRLNGIEEQQAVHTQAIMHLENKVMHELKLLNENLPNAVARHEAVVELEATVENHDARIYALEQRAANG